VTLALMMMNAARQCGSAPSPRRGEGWGEGVRKFEENFSVRTPSPSLRSTSPLRGEVTQGDVLA
jgi:hypothetical protein